MDSAQLENINQYEQGLDKESKYELVSLVAYLIGVEKRHFESEKEPPKIEIYDELEKNDAAKIVRALCLLRNSIERNYKRVTNAIIQEGRSIYAMHDILPTNEISYLESKGIRFSDQENKNSNNFLIKLNSELKNRMNNCSNLNHIVKWEYLVNMILMPDGDTKAGLEKAAELFYNNMAYYPYSTYINWIPQDEGNVLWSDSRFCYLLYKWNNDEFLEYNKVRDAGKDTKEIIYSFLKRNDNIHLVVDCENSNPYRLLATLNGLEEEYREKITRIVLIDDPHTSETWNKLEQYISIPIKYLEIERINDNKSIVDEEVIMECSELHYKENVDAFIMAASDSDYWPLVRRFTDCDFLFFVEHIKCGPDFKEGLITKGIPYCFIDDFYSKDSGWIIEEILLDNIRKELKEKCTIDLEELLDKQLWNLKAELNDSEKKYLFERYLRNIKININEDKVMTLEIKS